MPPKSSLQLSSGRHLFPLHLTTSLHAYLGSYLGSFRLSLGKVLLYRGSLRRHQFKTATHHPPPSLTHFLSHSKHISSHFHLCTWAHLHTFCPLYTSISIPRTFLQLAPSEPGTHRFAWSRSFGEHSTSQPRAHPPPKPLFLYLALDHTASQLSSHLPITGNFIYTI